MSRGKIIVIEGTDCSGKETQTKLLTERLKKNNIQVEYFSFPNYDSPTGKIVGGPVLGKKYLGKGYFQDGASKISPEVFSLYTAADRKYNIDRIKLLIDNGINVILDRYIYSNMAFQGSKFKDDLSKLNFFNWIEKLEFELLELPKPDINIFLHMPIDKTIELLELRNEEMDQNERDFEYLKNVEQTYFLLSNKYNFKIIECTSNNTLRDIESINIELYNLILRELK